MGDHLARLVLLAIPLGGCSLIFSPSRLPDVVDAPPDAPPFDCSMLTLQRVYPAELLEGQGDGGGRPAVLVIEGANIASNAKLEIMPHAGETNTPLLAFDLATVAIDSWGLRLAVPVKLSVDANINAAKSIRLDVKVTQPCEATGGATFTLDKLDGDLPALSLRGLDELSGAASLPTAMPHLYSRVAVTSLAAADRTDPLIVRSTSSFQITGPGPYSFSGADEITSGPGGNPGGAGGIGATGAPGSPGGGPGGGLKSGGGGGFAIKGNDGTVTNTGGRQSGDASLTSWGSANRSSGGAGGDGAILNLEGGRGGGGGGVVELTAAGTLMIAGKIQVNGGKGTTMNSSSGGGGSGGAVLLRAGGSISVGSVEALGGNSPQADPQGNGALGRVRFDSPDASAAITSSPTVGYRGPMFASTTELIVREAQPRITLVGQPSALIKYVIESREGVTRGPIELTLPGAGQTTVQLGMPLFEGYNRLCALVTGVIDRHDEAENCITLAYLHQ